MSKKQPPELPPGEYTAEVLRVRKVRNKSQIRIHYKCLEDGQHYSEVITP